MRHLDEELANNVRRIANAITSPVLAGTDEAGGRIESLTEAVMGITAGLFAISRAIDRLADASEDATDRQAPARTGKARSVI